MSCHKTENPIVTAVFILLKQERTFKVAIFTFQKNAPKRFTASLKHGKIFNRLDAYQSVLLISYTERFNMNTSIIRVGAEIMALCIARKSARKSLTEGKATFGGFGFHLQYRRSLMDVRNKLIFELKAKNATLTTAESITGGMIASSIVDVPGSSALFKFGFVTYSDEAKHEVLGVNSDLIEMETAVSPNVALEMAQGALKRSGADYAIAVTGLAGPGKDELGRNPGLVYICAASKHGIDVRELHFKGSRNEIRLKTTIVALRIALRMVKSGRSPEPNCWGFAPNPI